MIKIGIIGGTGLDNPEILKNPGEIEIEKTPYGKPSSSLKTGDIDGVDVVLLSRHGKDHTIPPSEVNYIANIYALKKQGVTHIIATTACGSLREEIERGDFVILDQYIDFTRKRRNSIYKTFEPKKPVHTPMSDPFDCRLRKTLIEAAEELKLKYHDGGTVITIEGPRFSTKAESKMYRIWGADVINMTVATEAAVANELGVPYAAVAMSTDYDCWKGDEKPVCMEEIMKVMKKNSKNVVKLLVRAVKKIRENIR
ncbi:MAG: S-methyl-5'-thioadenosine phosphorylase [archaeon]|nr:MAG: S-methyl-5'-thioadenosine phosphorylase [archaeon]